MVFALALAWLGPGFDAMLYGSDAGVYFAYGSRIASSGQLWVDDPLLAALPHGVEAKLFPSHGLVWDAARSRSSAGLAFLPLSPRVYSTFSQLPSVLLAHGWAVAGPSGAVWVTPALAAGAVAAFCVFLLRYVGRAAALVASALLLVSLPEVFFARMPMAEASAQFFLWSGLVALDSSRRDGSGCMAWLAGLGLGLATLARPEFLVLLPIAALLTWAVRPSFRLPTRVVLLGAALTAYATLLIFVLIPTHYREPARNALLQAYWHVRDIPTDPIDFVGLAVAFLALASYAAVAWVRARPGRGRRAARMGSVALALGWLVAYASRGGFESFGLGLAWMPTAALVAFAGLALVGLPLLWNRLAETPAGFFLLLLGALAAIHFLPAPHTAVGSGLWASRRLIPLVLPMMAAGAAVLVTYHRFPAGLRAAASAAIVGTLAWTSAVIPDRLFEGSSSAAAEIAAFASRSEVVLIDPSLQTPLLEVPLLVVHGRPAIGLRGVAGSFVESAELVRPHVDGGLVVLTPAILKLRGQGDAIGTTRHTIRTTNGSVLLAVQATSLAK